MTAQIRVATYNIHKGLTHFNRRLILHDLRQSLSLLEADVVLLQEVQGAHERRAARFVDWPGQTQHDFLAGDVFPHAVYGQNATHRHGHHGNAILSRFMIPRWENEDISVTRFERRGLLHAEVAVPGWPQHLHAICIHLNLWGGHRRQQLQSLIQRIQGMVPDGAPLLIAGDFNDWRREADRMLEHGLGVAEVFQHLHGQAAKSYPARFPMLHLDRIYARGLQAQQAHVHHGLPWARLSDHAPLSATLCPALCPPLPGATVGLSWQD